jgi:hypothetical protein
MDDKEIGTELTHWIHLIQDMLQRQAFVNTVMDIRFI